MKTESSSTGKAEEKQLQPGRDHRRQLQWQESAKGWPEVAVELGEMS